MARQPRRLSFRRRARPQTQQLAELLEFCIDHEDFVVARYKEHQKEIEDAKKEAKEKAEKDVKEKNFFTRRFTFGQTLFYITIFQLIALFGVLTYLKI